MAFGASSFGRVPFGSTTPSFRPTIKGTVSVTLGAATMVAVGKAIIRANASMTLAPATVASTAISYKKGVATMTLASATLSSTGKLTVKAAVAMTLAPATVQSSAIIRLLPPASRVSYATAGPRLANAAPGADKAERTATAVGGSRTATARR